MFNFSRSPRPSAQVDLSIDTISLGFQHIPTTFNLIGYYTQQQFCFTHLYTTKPGPPLFRWSSRKVYRDLFLMTYHLHQPPTASSPSEYPPPSNEPHHGAGNPRSARRWTCGSCSLRGRSPGLLWPLRLRRLRLCASHGRRRCGPLGQCVGDGDDWGEGRGMVGQKARNGWKLVAGEQVVSKKVQSEPFGRYMQ